VCCRDRAVAAVTLTAPRAVANGLMRVLKRGVWAYCF
jgi:hypothetical protein